MNKLINYLNFKRSVLRKKSKATFKNLVSNPNLAELGKTFGTDKADPHHSFDNLSYLDVYEKYLSEYRDKNISLLEIGVRKGDSLRTWKSYFQDGEIFGVDIDPSTKKSEEKRIRIEIGSQDDIQFLKTCFGEDKKFDIIIDDGSHVNKMTITSFEYLFNKRLRPGGIYIIEDLEASYLKLQADHDVRTNWPGMEHNNYTTNLDNDRKDINTFFLEKIDALDHLKGNILCLHFWSMVCVIIKTEK